MDHNAYLKKIDETIKNGKFKDTWGSLTKYQVPEWYRNAKFGIFIHWGVYSVPAFGNEWYPRNMYIEGDPAYNHHIEKYGKHKDFGYKDFIPMFKAEKFDAEQWAEIFYKSGARYIVPVAEHHDGFQMYKSDISHFNSYEMGPKKDIVGQLKEAVNEKGLSLCVSSHRVEHWFFMGHGKKFDSDVKEPLKKGDFYWPSMPEKDLGSVYSDIPTDEFMEDWLVRCCELVDNYKPDIFYFDWWIQIEAMKPYIRKFAAYYYNRAIEWGKEVAINYKHDAYVMGSAVPDIERGAFSEMKPYFWQTDTAVAKNSWCYTENNSYKEVKDIIGDFIDIVSKNGCLLLNIGPKSDGTIPEEDKNILLSMGKWLDINGEAIYNTTYWRIFGEGPTQTPDGHFTDSDSKNYKSEDIRFTINGCNLYASVLSYPVNGVVNIKSLSQKSKHFSGIIRDISVLGFDEKCDWQRTDDALVIRTKNVKSDLPVVFKITVD